MDWLMIAVFLIFMFIDAANKSKKKKQQRDERQQKTPTAPKRTILEPTTETPPPVVLPEWQFPTLFPFLIEEEEEEDREVETLTIEELGMPILEEIVPEDFSEKTFKPRIDTSIYNPPLEEVKEEKRDKKPLVKEPEKFSLKQAQMGIVWSEILDKPRALRPYRSRGFY